MALPFCGVMALAGVVGLLAAGQGARADALQDLAPAAGKKGPVVWYESSPPEQAESNCLDQSAAGTPRPFSPIARRRRA